jgi:hypothetical protein
MDSWPVGDKRKKPALQSVKRLFGPVKRRATEGYLLQLGQRPPEEICARKAFLQRIADSYQSAPVIILQNEGRIVKDIQVTLYKR